MLQKESRYAFKDRLLQIHKKDRRNYGIVPSTDEYEIKDGVAIYLPHHDPDDVVYTAAKDFCDYLYVSMGIGALITKSTVADVVLEYDQKLSGNMEYRIVTKADGIRIFGKDGRALAQALYFLEDTMNLKAAPYIKL